MSASALAKNFSASSSGITFDAGIQLGDFKYDLRRLISIAIIPVPSLITDYFNDDNLIKKYDLICDNFQKVFDNFPTLLTATQAAIANGRK